jgi:hypothetical protein
MRWEYKKVDTPRELTSFELNRLGLDRWELVSVVQTSSVRYIAEVRINTTSMVYYFKRPTE